MALVFGMLLSFALSAAPATTKSKATATDLRICDPCVLKQFTALSVNAHEVNGCFVAGIARQYTSYASLGSTLRGFSLGAKSQFVKDTYRISSRCLFTS